MKKLIYFKAGFNLIEHIFCLLLAITLPFILPLPFLVIVLPLLVIFIAKREDQFNKEFSILENPTKYLTDKDFKVRELAKKYLGKNK